MSQMKKVHAYLDRNFTIQELQEEWHLRIRGNKGTTHATKDQLIMAITDGFSFSYFIDDVMLGPDVMKLARQQFGASTAQTSNKFNALHHIFDANAPKPVAVGGTSKDANVGTLDTSSTSSLLRTVCRRCSRSRLRRSRTTCAV